MTKFVEEGKRLDEPRRILLVDDDDVYLHTMADWLRSYGYEVSEAKDGVEALRLMPEVQPDLVMADFLMPNMDGLALLKAIRESDVRLPVFLVTGHDDRLAEIALVSNSVTVVAPKTIDLNILKSHIEKLTRRW